MHQLTCLPSRSWTDHLARRKAERWGMYCCIEGLMECQEKSDTVQPFKGLFEIDSNSHVTIQTSGIMKKRQVLGATVWWEFHDTPSTQDRAAAGISQAGAAAALLRKGETISKDCRCIEQMLTAPEARQLRQARRRRDFQCHNAVGHTEHTQHAGSCCGWHCGCWFPGQMLTIPGADGGAQLVGDEGDATFLITWIVTIGRAGQSFRPQCQTAVRRKWRTGRCSCAIL